MGFVPVSFALTGPLAHLFGVSAVLIGAGLIGGALLLAFLFLPGMRDPERDARMRGTAPPVEAEALIRPTNLVN